MVEITLSPAEVCFASCLAAQRVSTKPENDRFLANKMSAYGSHLVGVIGEMAAAKVYGKKVDQRILRNGDRHSSDMLDRNRRKLEIKTVTFSGRDVMMKLHPEELLDDTWYVLVNVSLPDRCRVYDAVWGMTIREIAATKDFGYGSRIVVTSEQIEALKVQPA